MCSAECCDIWKNIEIKIIDFTSANYQELFPTIIINPYSEVRKGEIMFVKWRDFHKEDSYIDADAIIIYDNEYILECLPDHCEQSIDIGNAHFELVNRFPSKTFRNAASLYETFIYHYTKDVGILKITHELSEYRVDQMVLVSTEEYFAAL